MVGVNKVVFGVAILALATFMCASAAAVDGDVAPKVDKLNFAFYITSRCADTIRFVQNQLTPVFKEFEQYMNVEFFPWGKSKRNTDGSITCQFGASDCQANRLQSCALYTLGNNQARQVEYINCEMVTLSSVNLDYKCVRDVGLSESTVKQCFESSLGSELQSMAEEKTKTITMVFVPTIVYNNKYDAQVQSAAFSNFRAYVCSLLQKDNPNICK